MKSRFSPILFSIVKDEGYSLSLFKKDLSAGLIVGILSLPMSLAFAIASGVRPEQGLYTAIVAGFLSAFLGGSHTQVSGPTGAFVILIFSIVQQHGYEGLAVATLMAGILLVIMGLAKLGSVIKFIPYPVTIGFTSGLALVIFVGQLPDLLGLKLASNPVDFLGRVLCYSKNISLVNFFALGLSVLSILFVVFWPRVSNKIPGSLIAIFVTTLLVSFFHLPVETIGDRFGAITSSLPSLHIPNCNLKLIKEMISPAISIALLAGIESLLSAVVADGMKGTKHRSNTELVGIGIGNIGSVLFFGIPATGAIARTATNIRNGGETPVSAIIHAIVLAMSIFFFGKLISMIPMATLAGLLAVVAYNMSEWRHFAKIFSSPKFDILVLLTTFFITVFVGLVTAIQVGVVLSAFLFIHSIVETSDGLYLKETLKKEENEHTDYSHDISLESLPDSIEVFEIRGPFFFAATEKFNMSLKRINCNPKVLILRLRHVPFIDASGLRLLQDILVNTKKQGTLLLLSGVRKSILNIFIKNGFADQVGREHIFPRIKDTLKFAYSYLGLPYENGKAHIDHAHASNTQTLAEQVSSEKSVSVESLAKAETTEVIK